MLSGDVAKLLADALSEYNEFNAGHLLNMAASILSNRSPNNTNEYISQAASVRSQAQTMLNESKFAYLSQETIDLLNKSPYANLFPDRLARIIIRSLPEDPRLASTSGELQTYTSNYKKAVEAFNTYIEVSNALGQTYKPVEEGFLKLELKIPSRRYDDDLGSLGKKLELYDRFFEAVTELYGNADPKPTIQTVSSGSFITDLIAAAPVIGSVMDAYSKVLHCASQMIDIYKSTRTLREAGIQTPELDSREVAQTLVNKAFERHFEVFREAAPPEQANGLRMRMQTSAVFMVQEVQGGSRMSLNITSEQDLQSLVAANPNPAPDAAETVIEQIKLLQQQLDQKLASGENVPMLAPPADPAPRPTLPPEEKR